MDGNQRQTSCAARRLFCLALLAALLSVAGALPAAAQATIAAAVARGVANGGRVPVLIKLDVAAEYGSPSGLASEEAIQTVQTQVKGSLGRISGFKMNAAMKTVPWIAGEVDAAALEKLSKLPEVLAIGSSPSVHGTLAQSTVAIGARQTQQAYGATGAGVAIGMIDSGIDATHPDLQNAVLEGLHYNNDGTTDTNVQDESGHGTHLSGVITSDGVKAPAGVAPGAQLLVVKALNDNLTGTLNGVIYGMDWLIARKAAYPSLRFVNMSFSVNSSPISACPCDELGNTDAGYQALLDVIARAKAAGILCVAAAGNDGNGVMNAPACFSNVLSVGSTYDTQYAYGPGRPPTDQTTVITYHDLDSLFPACFDTKPTTDTVACYSSRGSCLTFVAPGYNITSCRANWTATNYTLTTFGTSISAAHVTGGLALLQGLLPTYSNAELVSLLQQTAKTVTDSAAPYRQYKRIDLFAAAKLAKKNAAHDWWIDY